MKTRVVITGLGQISPVGHTVNEAWANLLAGQSGIQHITQFSTEDLSCRFGGEVRPFTLNEQVPAKEARRIEAFMRYGIEAALEAITDAGLDDAVIDPHRVGVIIGSGIGGLCAIERAGLVLRENRRVSPFFIPSALSNLVAAQVGIIKGYQGPSFAPVSACATGAHSIALAARSIAYGETDVMIAGGTEGALSRLGLIGFNAMKALSLRNDNPQAASRPWDRDRDGFVMSDGAGVLVLESLDHAKRRGARIWAELAGVGMSSDAYHITAPYVDGSVRSMRNALQDAGVAAEEVQYLNAHGTSTPVGDANETEAIKKVFGDHARKMVVSSTKSMTGHLLGGAGGVEAVYTALSVHEQKSPPTINLDEPDLAKGCDLDYCAHTARDLPIDVAVSNSFGFGGTNVTLVIRRF